jgi:hypothetical protein
MMSQALMWKVFNVIRIVVRTVYPMSISVCCNNVD